MSKTLSAALLSCAFLVQPALAQWEIYKLSARGDYFEGVAREQVSGGTIDLVAVHYVSAGETELGTDLHLFFSLPEAQKVEIEVRNPTRQNYVMVPKTKSFPAGHDEFSWPTAPVIKPLGLKVGDFRATVKSVSRNLYFPALLSTTRTPKAAGRYVFIFQSGAAVDYEATLSRQTEGRLTPVRKFNGSEDPGSFKVSWDGLEANGKPAPKGVYLLSLEASLDTATPLSLTSTVYFQTYDAAR